jgi:predicted TIM-barrel fold metal-dependent hydrolase/ketosteroid isomerase-like protein
MRSQLAILALVLPAILTAQQPSRAVEASIRRLEERWRAAQQANDTAAFRELLAPDVTFIGTSGSLRDRAGYIASRSGSWILRSTAFTVDELRLRFYGTVVIVTGRGTSTGAGTAATGRFTHVWARRNETWMLVAIQRTEIAPPAQSRSDTAVQAPRVDYHQHLVSPAFAPIVKLPIRDGKKLLAELDSAGIGKAVVLSVAYSFADERKKLDDPDRLTREENDWTSTQVAASGGRLIGFCSANPLRPVALDELRRCLALPGMKGIKLHFGNSGVSLRNPAHAARMVEVFTFAERMRAPILVHMRARGGSDYGAEDARLFLSTLLPVAPSIEIVVAHLGGAGPGYPPQADEVMAVFGDAAEHDDPRMRNVYFDVATVVTAESTVADVALVARRIRQVGVRKTLYGSDLSPPGGSVRAGWEIFRNKVPLTAAEFQTIADNLTRFAR